MLNEHSKKTELSKVSLDLSNNGYSYKLINKCEKNILILRFLGENSEEPKQILAASYIRGVTEEINKILKPHKINFFSKFTDSFRNKDSRIKDRRNSKDKNNVIYKINCKDFDATYIV